jgi:protein dithiol oxidoreductase (disulfide-forming)
MKALARLLLACLTLACATAFAAPATPALQEGVHYERTAVGPYAPQAGKIEVVEVFGYTCGHCARFETTLHPWTQRLPADVVFTPVPAAFGGFWDPWARAYFAARQLGVSRASHQAVFDAIHVKRSLPASGITPAALGNFYQAYGVTPAAFEAALRGDKTQQEMTRARQYAMDAQVAGTPTLIVNGKYKVLGNSFEQMLSNADALIARERRAAAGK